ncbi:hypothetical protein F4777DRAFT_590123 [Nemania sp. FL0916]|nr:hypothetical protein F4777DRAFT_590123 [Nemania sp. FL0916]
MDPMEQFFRALPAPADDDAALQQRGTWDSAHFARVFMDFSSSQSNDPDHESIVRVTKAFQKIQESVVLRSQLGRLALDGRQIPDDNSAKSEQLRYHAWISQGRKDEEYPFERHTIKQHTGSPQTDLPKDDHAFLPAELTDPRICAYCGNSGAEDACVLCLLTIDSHVIIKTPYCDHSCQTHHRKDHLSTCQERRWLYQAVSLIHDLAAMFLKKASVGIPIENINEKQGITNVTQGGSDEVYLQGKPLIRPFPSAVAPSEEHALAAMFDTGCLPILSLFQEFVKLLLQPWCKLVREARITARNAHRPVSHKVTGVVYNNMYSQHTVLWATLQSGEEMIIDIAGARFGWRETIALAKDWTAHRTIGGSWHSPYGTTQRLLRSEIFFSPQDLRLIDSRRLYLAKRMLLAVQNKIVGGIFSPTTPLNEFKNGFRFTPKKDCLSAAEKALDEGLHELYESKVCLGYVNAEGRQQATVLKEQAEVLERVWLKPEDITKAKAEGRNLNSLYVERCKSQTDRQAFEDVGVSIP